jgi:hypothetical protein
MDKKDIYEHLAKIYLDASSKKQKQSRTYPRILKGPFLIGTLSLLAILALGLAFLAKNKPFNSRVALVLSADALKINFNFDPAKKEIYSLDLNKLDLTKYKALTFSLKKANFQDTISLRVEFTNSFKEKSEVYIIDVPHKWKDYKINFSDFKKISYWNEMVNLAFAVEEWNAKSNTGVVYIDNIGLTK